MLLQGNNPTGIQKNLLTSGTARVKTGEFVAREACKRIRIDDRVAREAFIRRNNLLYTENDALMKLKKLQADLKLFR